MDSEAAMRNVLLTSPRGPLAHALNASLTLAGVQTAVLAKEIRGAHPALPARMREDALVAEAMAAFDVVIDTRPPPDDGRGTWALARNYARATRQVVATAAMAGVPRLIIVRPLSRPGTQRWLWQCVDDIAMAASRGGLSVATVAVAPLFGPEPGVTTDLNALIARVISGRQRVVARAATSVLSAADAAEAIVHAAWNRDVDHLVLPGTLHTYQEVAEVVADLAAAPGSAVAPKALAMTLSALGDVHAPWRGPRLPLPRCRFSRCRHPRSVASGLAHHVLRENLAATVAHFRGTVRTIDAPNG